MTFRQIVATKAIDTCRDAVIDMLAKAEVGFITTSGRVKRIRDWKPMPDDIKEVWVEVAVTFWKEDEAEVLVLCLIDREANYNVMQMYYGRELLWSFDKGITEVIDSLRR